MNKTSLDGALNLEMTLSPRPALLTTFPHRLLIFVQPAFVIAHSLQNILMNVQPKE